MVELILSAIGWETILKMVVDYVAKYPEFALFLLAVGTLRTVMKPIMTFLRKYVESTPYDSDDKWLDSVETSKAYKALVYAMDWLLSVKLPDKKQNKN